MRPRDLADHVSSTTATKTFTLPVAEARVKAREIINQASGKSVISVIENWRSVGGERIEFTVRDIPRPD
jgi:hypothetical protein